MTLVATSEATAIAFPDGLRPSASDMPILSALDGLVVNEASSLWLRFGSLSLDRTGQLPDNRQASKLLRLLGAPTRPAIATTPISRG